MYVYIFSTVKQNLRLLVEDHWVIKILCNSSRNFNRRFNFRLLMWVSTGQQHPNVSVIAMPPIESNQMLRQADTCMKTHNKHPNPHLLLTYSISAHDNITYLSKLLLWFVHLITLVVFCVLQLLSNRLLLLVQSLIILCRIF